MPIIQTIVQGSTLPQSYRVFSQDVNSLTGADGNVYYRYRWGDTSNALCWKMKTVATYYTSGLSTPAVGATIYKNTSLTTTQTTVASIQQGLLTNSRETAWVPLPAGTTNLQDYDLAGAYMETPANKLSGAIDLSSITVLTGLYAFDNCFRDCPGITSVNLNGLTSVYGANNAFNSTFLGCTGLTSLQMSNLTYVLGNNAFSYTFSGSNLSGDIDLSQITTIAGTGVFSYTFRESKITSLNLSGITQLVQVQPHLGLSSAWSPNNALYCLCRDCPNLETLDLSGLTRIEGMECLRYLCNNCPRLTKVDLSSLTTMTGGGQSSMDSMCANDIALTECDLSSLTTVSGHYSMQKIFQGCTSLTKYSFQSLATMNEQTVLQEGFRNSGIQDLRFPALKNFGGLNNQFNNMLLGCSNVTVHFLMSVQSSMSSWASVLAGFGGTNTTVLFDVVGTLTGADTNTYTRKEKLSTATATAWVYNDTTYYTLGLEPSVGDTIYSDAECTVAVTTIDAIA